jgi:hypothetical protein
MTESPQERARFYERAGIKCQMCSDTGTVTGVHFPRGFHACPKCNPERIVRRIKPYRPLMEFTPDKTIMRNTHEIVQAAFGREQAQSVKRARFQFCFLGIAIGLWACEILHYLKGAS